MGRVCKNESSGFDILRKWMNERIGVHFEVPDLYYLVPSLSELTVRKLVRWLMCAGFISRESRGYYKIDKHISTKINTTELEKLAYPRRKSCKKLLH